MAWQAMDASDVTGKDEDTAEHPHKVREHINSFLMRPLQTMLSNGFYLLLYFLIPLSLVHWPFLLCLFWNRLLDLFCMILL